ncbi:MAG: DUF115 domain-containing protein [Treponema sp.]|jgi:hypothetical protein|nr:DUF115 domain-containing protein [Treponema sp.]
MDKFLFERNLLALSPRDPALCSRLSAAETTLGRYKCIESRSGEPVPAWVDPSGAAHPLHSLVDPRREGRRLISTLGDEGFLVFLGLGGGYAVQAALERDDTHQALVIEYDINGIAELLSSQDYIALFKDPRFSLIVDPSGAAVEACILELYKPVLHGGIRSIPLRARTSFDQGSFAAAGEAVKSAVDRVSGDYSVQAYFGKRWFSNILRNLFAAEGCTEPFPRTRNAAIIAAGPSLDRQLPALAERRGERFLIAADTSLPSLLAARLEPDAVISIDCQHISYYHFLGGMPRRIPLYLDLASPPLLASLSDHVRFFTGGHPLERYVSQYWRSLPALDTSGANVTYAALSLAESLGAVRIELYGADFAYPRGRTYARGTYIYPYFAKQQSRLKPLEALFSAFLYRNPSLTRCNGATDAGWYYETKALRMYRERLEAKIPAAGAEVIPIPGGGAPIAAVKGRTGPRPLTLVSPGKAAMGAAAFLDRYRKSIAALPPMRGKPPAYPGSLGAEERLIFTTLLPAAAAIRSRRPELKDGGLLEELRRCCLGELDMVLNQMP